MISGGRRGVLKLSRILKFDSTVVHVYMICNPVSRHPFKAEQTPIRLAEEVIHVTPVKHVKQSKYQCGRLRNSVSRFTA